MNNFYPQQTKVITKQATSLFSFALKALGIFLLFMAWSVGSANAKTWYVINNTSRTVDETEIVGWANYENWTEDPAAQVFSNPGPTIPANGDHIVIRAGKEITLPAAFIVNAGTVTVDGILYIEGATDSHVFTALRGSGRVYIRGSKLPAGNLSHFTSAGPGAGTVVLRGEGPIAITEALSVYNLEIEMSASEKTVTLSNNVTVNGSLNVKRGRLLMGGTIARTLDVKKNVFVQDGGHIGVSIQGAYHNFIVWGDFKNYGSVKMSNALQYAAATNGAIRLTFEGASNNDFIINGSTQLYRLFINKGENDFYTLSVTSNNIDHFKLMGPYEGSTGLETSESGLEGWERLPLVIRNGTLKLGSNIKIDRLGYDRDGAGVKEFHIPSGAALWVNGAEVQTMTSVNNYEIGLTLSGTLKISAGRFVVPAYARGIRYKGDAEQPARLFIEGGELRTTSIRQNSSDAALTFSQSGGVIEFPYLEGGGDQYGYAVFNMINAADVFEMSGGKMIYKVADSNNVSGIHIDVKEGNANVTGGEVVVHTAGLGSRDFKICSTAPIFNLTTIGTHSTREVQMTNQYGNLTDTYHYGDFSILGDLNIGAGSRFNTGAYNLVVGGDVKLFGTFINNGTLGLNGTKSSVLENNTSSTFSIANLYLTKSSSDAIVTISGTGSNSFSFGQVNLNRGNLDLSNKSITVTGAVNLHNGSLLATGTGSTGSTGSATLSDGVILNSSRGKENSFGYLKLASGATVNLSSHAKAKKVDFLGAGVFNLGENNLEIEESNYAAVTGWGTTKMFRTAGKASDGGLTLQFSLSATQTGSVAFFPIGTSLATMVFRSTNVGIINGGNPTNTSGYLTVVPVDGKHPATNEDKKDGVLPYYWRTKVSGFETLDEGKVQLEFTSPGEKLKGLKGAFLDGYEWKLGSVKYNKENVLIFNNSPNYGEYQLLINSDYTAGLDNGDGHIPIASVRVFKSTGNHNWDSSFWVDAKGVAGTPSASDVAVILPYDTITIASNEAVASQVDIQGVLKVNSSTRNHKFDIIKGNGKLIYEYNSTENNQYRIQNIISADYSEFINSPEAIIEYAGTGGYGLAEVSKIPYYPNLHISGGTTNVKTHRNDGSLRVRGNLVIKDAPLAVEGNDSQTIEIGQNLIIENSSFSLAAAGNTNTFIAGNIQFTGTGSLLGRNSNEVHLQGNIEQGNGTINTPSEKWFLEGDMPSIISGNNAGAPNKAVFNRLIIDKKEGVEVGFEAPFTLNAAANGTTDDKPFLLRSGVARLNHADIDLILNSGGGDFQIPSTSTLIVDNGSKVRASGNGSSLFLDGALVVDNEGEFLWEGAGGNHIKYSASGNASIWLGKDAKFYVGSQLFRNSEGGILNFTQANASSEVRIATIDAPLATKGVFEVLNQGSSFTQSQDNSVITVVRGQSGSNPVPAIRYNPSTWSVAKGSKMVVGNASTSSSVGLYADQPLGGLDLVGATTLDVWVAPLTLNGTLNIGAGSTFNAADLDLTLKGDLLANGHFNPGINTTYFSGLVDQQITGNIDFYNLSKLDGSNSLVIDDLANVKVGNHLLVEKGSIDTGDNNLVVKGNASVLLEATVGGIELSGDKMQLLSGGGDIGRLIINNDNSVMVPSQPDAISVTSKLVLSEGVFDIGSNLLQLGKDAVVVDKDGGSNFSADNMIQTFLSFTDAGIRKYFPTISSPTTFIYPIGSQNKYTPVTFVIDEITSANGYIRVKAANERHISVIDDPKTEMIEPDNVLRYYWTIDAKDITGFKAKVNMQAYANDVAPPTEGDNYIVARILANNDLWNKENLPDASVEGERIFFDNANSKLVFNGYFFNGTNDIGISGDYTAGLASAIPDKVPTVISVNTGDWNSVSTWAVYDPVSGTVGAAGEGIPQNGPLGSIVYIRENVNVTTNGRIAYRTHIEENGTLNVGSTINNRLGNVSGKGRLRVESGSLPAGFYEEFAQPAGGVFEYSGTGSYSVLGGINTLNSAELTGAGERKLPDGTIRLHGNLLIDGPSVNMRETTQVQIGRNFTFNNGRLDLGTESQFVFNGTSTQTVGGIKTFTGSNALQIVRINNSAGVKIATNLTINKHLQLDRGIVSLGGGVILHLGAETTTEGASDNSFVNGFLSKFINGNESFEFPVGDQGRYGAFGVADKTPTGGTWVVKYNDATPPNRDQKVNIAYVSNNEYWELIAPSAEAIAAATLRWDEESGINPDVFDVVTSEPDLASPVWSVVNKQNVDKLGQKVAVANLAHNPRRYFSFGLQTMPEVGDYTWKGLESADWFNPANWYGAKVPSAGTPALITTADLIQAPTNWPVIEGSNIAQVNHLTIETGTNLTLNPGGKLTVNGDLTINGDFTLKNTYAPNGLASLMTHGTVSGQTDVELTLPTNQWYYLSSPMKNSSYDHFGATNPGARVYAYRKAWQQYPNGPSLEGLEGTLTIFDSTDPSVTESVIKYSGEINSGEVERVLTSKGFYLFGNPYPTSINWQDDDWKASMPRVYGTIWYRTRVNQDMTFVTYNRNADPNTRVAMYPDNTEMWDEEALALIPPYQSVWIYSKTASAASPVTLKVTPNLRKHGLGEGGGTLKSSRGGAKTDIIRLVSENETSRDGTVIYFSENATDGFDPGDSPKYFNSAVRIPEVYTRSAGEILSINGLAPFEGSLDLPLSVRNRVEGPVDLKFDVSLYRSDDVILLHDTYLDAEINLRKVSQYRYEPFNLGDSHDRFVIRFNPEGYEDDNVSTPVDEKAVGNSDHLINITGINGRAIVSIDRALLQDASGQIEVFNVAGAKISEFKAKTNKTFIVLPETPGVYLVVVKVGGKMKSKKLVR